MNAFEAGLSKYLNPEQLMKMQKAHIGIAGAGGLGSNCAAMLVRCGFNHIKIVDMDEVSASNLNRQNYTLDQVGLGKVAALKENLCKINPALKIEVIHQKIEKDNIESMFADCDILIEALDVPEMKVLFVETFAGKKKFVVSVSGLAGFGDSDRIKVKKIRPDFYMVGDFVSDIKCKPPLAPSVTIAAAKQADLVLAHVIG